MKVKLWKTIDKQKMIFLSGLCKPLNTETYSSVRVIIIGSGCINNQWSDEIGWENNSYAINAPFIWSSVMDLLLSRGEFIVGEKMDLHSGTRAI